MKNLFNYAGKLGVLAALVILAACNSTSKNGAATDSLVKDTAKTVKAAPVDSGKLIGVWHDESIKSDKGEEIAYEVISSGKKIFIQAITFTGKNLQLNDTPPITPSASEIKRDGDKFVSVERPTETYKVDKTGNLLLYDDGKLVAVCKKLL